MRHVCSRTNANERKSERQPEKERSDKLFINLKLSVQLANSRLIINRLLIDSKQHNSLTVMFDFPVSQLLVQTRLFIYQLLHLFTEALFIYQIISLLSIFCYKFCTFKERTNISFNRSIILIYDVFVESKSSLEQYKYS